MKKVLVLFMLLLTLCSFSQTNYKNEKYTDITPDVENWLNNVVNGVNESDITGWGIGYKLNGKFNMSSVMIFNNVMFGYDFQYGEGGIGDRYTTINWNDDHLDGYQSITSSFDQWTFSGGYVYNNLYVKCGISFYTETLYKNSYDNYHILSNSGYYYKETRGNGGFTEPIVELGVIGNNMVVGLSYSEYTGVKLNLGLYINMK